jgi:hypothetical protein
MKKTVSMEIGKLLSDKDDYQDRVGKGLEELSNMIFIL